MNDNPLSDDHRKVVRLNREYYDSHALMLQEFNQASKNPGFHAYMRRSLDRCRELIGPVPDGMRILDVGTGQGHLLPYLGELASMERIDALDVSENNIDVARSRFPLVHFSREDFVLDFTPVHQYNLISAYSVLHHIVDWRGFLTKAAECLAPSGVLYLDHDPLRSLLTKLYTALWHMKHPRDKASTLMEYHVFQSGGFDPQAIVEHFGPGFHVEVFYSNVGLIQETFKLTGLNLWRVIPSELRVDELWKKYLRFFFLHFKILARKK